MSASNVLLQPGRQCVHLITDGAATLPDGTIHSIGKKISTVANGRGAIAFRGGAGPWVHWIPDKLCAAPSFDTCVRWLEDYGPKAHRFGLALNPHWVGQHACMEINLIGWSESAREAQAWFMTSHPDISGYDDLPALHLDRTEFPRGAPAVSDVLRAIGLPDSPSWDDVDALDPEAVAISWVTAQRHTTDAEAGWPYHSVGGFVEIATASIDGIARRVVRRWDDEPGRCITP